MAGPDPNGTHLHTRSRHAYKENVFSNVSCLFLSFFFLFFFLFSKFQKFRKFKNVSFPKLRAEFLVFTKNSRTKKKKLKKIGKTKLKTNS